MNPRIHSKTPTGLTSRIALVVICFGLLMSGSLAQKVEVDETQGRPLINIGSGKCFAPTPQGGASDRNGLPIQQRTCSPSPGSIEGQSQDYWFQSQGLVAFNDQGPFGWLCVFGCIPNQTEGYLIRNGYTNLCLDARDGARTNGSVVQQWECRDRNARSMVWYVEQGDLPYNIFKVRNFNSDLCLDVRGGSSEEYTQLQQYRCTSGNPAQNFSQRFPAGPVVNLNGRWTDGSTRSAVISGGLSIVIDMSAFNRPAARGRFVSLSTIEVNFPDDATFKGEVSRTFTAPEVSRTTITWSNGSVWTKTP